MGHQSAGRAITKSSVTRLEPGVKLTSRFAATLLSVRLSTIIVALAAAVGNNFNLSRQACGGSGYLLWQDVQIFDARLVPASKLTGRQIPLVTKRGPQSQPY